MDLLSYSSFLLRGEGAQEVSIYRIDLINEAVETDSQNKTSYVTTMHDG